MSFLLSLPKSEGTQSIRLQGEMSPLQLKLSPLTYNQVCNIDKLLTMDEKTPLEHQLINEKA